MLLAARACGDWSWALFDFAREPVPDFDIEDHSPPPDSKEDVDLEADKGITHENREPAFEEQTEDEDADLPGRKMLLILEGPYGGPTLRASEYERVLLFAGGSGVTFTLSVLDELVGRAVRSRLAPNPQHGTVKTRRVVWCWCVRSFGAIHWFAPYILQIATLAALVSAISHIRRTQILWP